MLLHENVLILPLCSPPLSSPTLTSLTKLLKVADVQTHFGAKSSRICAFFTFDCETGQTCTFYDFSTIYQFFLKGLNVFYCSLGPFLGENFSVRKYGQRKKKSYLRSPVCLLPLLLLFLLLQLKVYCLVWP